ncbi:MAG: hypothetical protein AABX33_06950 [Nanoarchaeota archaeon]
MRVSTAARNLVQRIKDFSNYNLTTLVPIDARVSSSQKRELGYGSGNTPYLLIHLIDPNSVEYAAHYSPLEFSLGGNVSQEVYGGLNSQHNGHFVGNLTISEMKPGLFAKRGTSGKVNGTLAVGDKKYRAEFAYQFANGERVRTTSTLYTKKHPQAPV